MEGPLARPTTCKSDLIRLCMYAAKKESWSLNRKTVTAPADIFEGHCSVLYTFPPPSVSISLSPSPSVHQCTQLKAPIIMLTAFWCPHINAPRASLILEGGWWAERNGTKMRRRAGDGWLCLIKGCARVGLAGCCYSMQWHGRFERF